MISLPWETEWLSDTRYCESLKRDYFAIPQVFEFPEPSSNSNVECLEKNWTISTANVGNRKSQRRKSTTTVEIEFFEILTCRENTRRFIGKMRSASWKRHFENRFQNLIFTSIPIRSWLVFLLHAPFNTPVRLNMTRNSKWRRFTRRVYIFSVISYGRDSDFLTGLG